MVTAGVAKLDITPPVGVRMAGFAGRTMPALGVHDPLCARVLLLDDGNRRAALMVCDIIGVSDQLVAQVRAGAAAFGLSPEALLIAGTHTHSGPARPGDDSTSQEKAYWQELPSRLISCLSQAVAARGPASLSYTCGWAAIGVNRRHRLRCGHITLGHNQYGRIDNDLGLLRVDREGKPYAALMNHACHGVSLLSDNYLLSADYPGHAAHYVERALPGATALYFNGACGNINPRECALVDGITDLGSYLVAQRAGEAIAREVASIWPEAEALDEPAISCAQRVIELPTNPDRAREAAERAARQAQPSDEEQAEFTRYDHWDPRADRDRALRRWEQIQKEGVPPVKGEIQVISLGPIAFLGWPGEVFCELAITAKRRSPFSQTFVIGYANGSIGYVPTPQAYREGGYEVQAAIHLADHAGVVLVEESLKLLAEVAGR